LRKEITYYVLAAVHEHPQFTHALFIVALGIVTYIVDSSAKLYVPGAVPVCDPKSQTRALIACFSSSHLTLPVFCPPPSSAQTK
jgi:hypothetical protein